MDGSRRISLRNRQFLRKFTPFEQLTPSHLHSGKQGDHSEPPPPMVTDQNVIIPAPVGQEPNMEAARSRGDDNLDLPVLMYPAPDITPVTPRSVVGDEMTRYPSIQTEMSHENSPPVHTQILPPVGGGLAGGGEGNTSTVRRSARTTRGQTTRFEDFVTGNQFDNATSGIGCLACSPTCCGPTSVGSEGGQVLYAYKLPAGYEPTMHSAYT